jgi:hypothetical protein
MQWHEFNYTEQDIICHSYTFIVDEVTLQTINMYPGLPATKQLADLSFCFS